MRLQVTAACVALIVCAGCMRRDPVKSAIKHLGGAESVSRKAAMALCLTSRNPVPDLVETVRNERAKRRVRVSCIEILGDIAKRQNDKEALAFLLELLGSDDSEFCEKAVRGFVGTVYDDAVPALIKLKKGADAELLRLIEEALESTAEKMVRDVEKLWNSPGAALAEYERVEKLGLDRGPMGYSKARFLDMRGRTKEAARKYDEMGIIRRYWLIGPFPNRQGMGFRQVYPPEQGVDLAAEYQYGLNPVKWYRMERDLPEGRLDFELYFVETDNVLAYTLIFLISDREQTIEIRAGSDDTLTLFLNGEIIWAHEQYRAVKFDDDVVPVTLKRGVNAVLFKVCEDWGGWQQMARITGPGDTPLRGVEITLDVPTEMP